MQQNLCGAYFAREKTNSMSEFGKKMNFYRQNKCRYRRQNPNAGL